jgi:hypothetical protein
MTPTPEQLRDWILNELSTLRVPISAEQLDHALRVAEHRGDSHLAFLRELVGTAAIDRHERSSCHTGRISSCSADKADNVSRVDHVTPADRRHHGWDPDGKQPMRYRAIDYPAVRRQISLSRALNRLSFEPAPS